MFIVFTANFLTPAAAETKADIRIAGVTYLGDLPTLVADRRALFQLEGLRVRVGYGHSGKENLERLRSGETDFALMALTPLVINRLADATPGEDNDPVILASLVHSIHLNQVVTMKDRGFRYPVDLQSHRVGLMKGTNTEFVWWLFAAYHGFEPTAVRIIDKPTSELPKALAGGRIDAAVIWEPWTTRLRSRLGDRLQVFPHSDVYTAKWVVVTSRRTARTRSVICRSVLSAYHQAIEYIDRHPDAAMQMYAKQVNVDLTGVSAHREALDYDLGLDWSLITTWQQQIDWARRAGYPVAGPDPPVLSVIEAGPLRSIDPAAVSIPARTAADQQKVP